MNLESLPVPRCGIILFRLLGLVLATALPLRAGTVENISLKDESAKTVTLGSLKDKDEILVMIFAASTCPITNLYWERIKGLWYNFRDQHVKFVIIGGNQDDTAKQIHDLITKRELDLKVYWDENHRLANQWGIHFTPIAAVLGRNGNLLYRGRIDDSWRDESHISNRYLQKAIESALKDNPTPNRLDDDFMGSRMR